MLERNWSRRLFAVIEKDVLIYYKKGPVVSFGLLFPAFLFLAFSLGRDLPLNFLISGLFSMTLFFTATAVSPVIFPWEGSIGTLERLLSAPISMETILLGDILSSFIFGVAITLVPLVVGILMGIGVIDSVVLILATLLGAFCFSSMGVLLSTPPWNAPSNIMMLSNLVKFPLIFISGVFVPLEATPIWGQNLAFLSPITYLMDLVRHSFMGISYFPVVIDFIALVVFSGVFFGIAIILHKRNMPKRL